VGTLDAFVPPLFRLPHVVIEPSALRAANAYSFDYLSLAEVQVMGIDPLRFAKVDYSSTHNDFDGSYNCQRVRLNLHNLSYLTL
jgi:hypothetical protein